MDNSDSETKRNTGSMVSAHGHIGGDALNEGGTSDSKIIGRGSRENWNALLFIAVAKL